MLVGLKVDIAANRAEVGGCLTEQDDRRDKHRDKYGCCRAQTPFKVRIRRMHSLFSSMTPKSPMGWHWTPATPPPAWAVLVPRTQARPARVVELMQWLSGF